MIVDIRPDSSTALAAYAGVPIAFEVREQFSVVPHDAGLGGLGLVPEPVSPYTKDYDAYPGNHPTDWPVRFDLSSWGILASWAEGVRIGGTVIAWGSPGLDLLEEREDLAVLWDLRVAPQWRGRGVGAALFRAASSWALARGARWLKVETQNVNVDACRFYARQGCTLGALHRYAYPELPGEVKLLWYKELGSAAGSST